MKTNEISTSAESSPDPGKPVRQETTARKYCNDTNQWIAHLRLVSREWQALPAWRRGPTGVLNTGTRTVSAKDAQGGAK